MRTLLVVRILAALSFTVFFAVATVLMLQTRQPIRELNRVVIATLEDAKKTSETTRQFAEQNYWEAVAQVETTTALLKATYDAVVDTNANLNGGKNVHGLVQPGVLPTLQSAVTESQMMIKALTMAVQAFQSDADELLGKGSPTYASAGALAALLATLDEQVKEGGPRLSKTLDELEKLVKDLDKLAADPNIALTLGHVEKTSGHIQNSAESVDLALRPLREKAAMLKIVLMKAIGLFRVVWKIP